MLDVLILATIIAPIVLALVELIKRTVTIKKILFHSLHLQWVFLLAL